MNPELRDPERVMPSDPKAAVVAKAEQVEANLKAAQEGMKELQKLMGMVPTSDLKPELANQVAELRIALVEQAQSLGMHALAPLIVKALFQARPGS